jgi:hypothetical protein
MAVKAVRQALSPGAIAGLVVAAVLLILLLGWRYMRSVEVPPPSQRTGGLTRDQFMKDMKGTGRAGAMGGVTPVDGAARSVPPSSGARPTR